MSTTSVRLWTSAVVVFGLVQIARAVSRFVVSVSSRQARVFRWRHLTACGACLLTVGIVLVTLLLVRGPLSAVLSHGRITGGDIADVGFVIAAGICSVGAVAALIASVAEFRAEHAWSHSHLPWPPG